MKVLYDQIYADLKEKTDKKNALAKELGGASSPTATAEMNMLLSEVRLIQQRIVDAKEDLVNLEVNKELQTRAATSPNVINSAVAEELDKDPTMQSSNKSNMLKPTNP